MSSVYWIIEGINAVSGWLCGLVLGPACRVGPWTGLLLISLLTGAGALWVIKKVSNQDAVRRTRNRLIARVLELVLYKDDMASVFGAFGRIVISMGPYLKENLKPLAVLIVPFMLIMIQLAAWYEWRPIEPGESVLLTAHLDEGTPLLATPLGLNVPDTLAVDAGPVRVPRLNEVSWRLRGMEPGSSDVVLSGLEGVLTKEVVISSSMARVSPRRVGRDAWALLMYPLERRLPPDAGVERIDLAYPPGDLYLGTWRIHWLLAFFVLTMIFALALRGPMRVEL